MAREVLSNGVINPDKYQADWYADLSNNWNLLNNLIGSAISSSEVDSKIATAIQELMVRTFQIVAELPETGTEGVMYLVLIPNTSKYTAYVWENSAYRELGVIQMTITIDDELSTTSENPVQNKAITNALGGKANTSHTHSASDITSGLATVATSGSYNDLSNKPTIPTVNNATLTIQKNGTDVKTFTANASTDVTCNITVPTKTSDLTNDSNFITEDTTKIPLSGSNQISGDLIPATTNAYDLGGSSYQWNNAYIKSLTINGVACGDILTHNASEFVPKSGGAVISGVELYRTADDSKLIFGGATTGSNGASIELYGKNHSSFGGWTVITPRDSNGYYQMILKPDGTATWGSKNLAMQEDVIPRSGGAVITGNTLARNEDGGYLELCASTRGLVGPTISLYGSDGVMQLLPSLNGNYTEMKLQYSGTLTWSGQPIQYVSDQRLKQQIAEIDDKLLDAWEDVDLVQFKYNDAVEEKSDNARLHTGYVVQQIDDACKKHNVDVSKYGLYCHEEYAEETREVEQADGTKKTEVVRPANEHYSLRYTEALIVECAFLRKKNKELQEQLDKLSARLDKLESASSK